MLLLVGCEQETSQDFYQRAIQYHERGEFASSIIELKNALQRNPENADARFLLGQIYLKTRNLAGAEKELLHAQKYGIPAGKLIEPLSRTWFLQGQFQKVLTELPLSAFSGADRSLVLLIHGRAYAGLGRYEDARAAFEKVLESRQNDPAALIEIARLEIGANRLDTARQLLARLEHLDPTNLEVVALNGDVALKSREFRRAVARYRQVLKNIPGHIPTKVALASALLGFGETGEAERILESALRQSPRLSDANYLRAVLAVKQQDYEMALTHAERVLETKPNHEPSLLISATAYFATGLLPLAERNLRRFIQLNPDHAFATQLLSAIQKEAEMRNHRYQRAFLIDDYALPADVAAFIDPYVEVRNILDVGLAYVDGLHDEFHQLREDRGADGLMDEARRMIGRDKTSSAILLLERALERDPGLAEAWIVLGQINLRSGKFEKALEVSQSGLRNHGNRRDLLMLVAMSNFLTGNGDAALLALRSLEELDRDAPEVQFVSALIYRRLWAEKASRDKLERSLALNPEYAPAIAERARVALAEFEVHQAEAGLRRLSGRWPNDPRFLDLSGGLALIQGNFAGAAESYRSALMMRPTSVRALRLAYAEQRAGHVKESYAVLEDWRRSHPSDTDVLLALANKYLAAEQFLEASEIYSEFLHQRPNDIVALNNLALISLRLGETDIALAHVRRAIDYAPQDPRLMDTLAEIHLTRGESQQALPLLRRAGRLLDAPPPGLQFRLAQALMLEGRAIEARQLLTQILDKQADFSERREAEALLTQLQE